MSTKKWLIIATSLVAIGLIIFATVMSIYKWDFSKLGTGGFEMKTHTIKDKFSNISINTDTADIVFSPSNDATYTVECFDAKNVFHTVKVENGTLIIDVVDERKWYEHIGINFCKSTVTIHIPQTEYGTLTINGNTGDLNLPSAFSFNCIDVSLSTGDISIYASAHDTVKLKTRTGSIDVKNITASTLDLTVSTGKLNISDVNCTDDIQVKVSTGKATLTNIECKNVISAGNTGDISLNNVIASEKFTIERTTGDIEFENCDASEIFMKTSTGDVEGSLLTDKHFSAWTSTGNISVPKTTTGGGNCEIHTGTGDIKITVE